ncbi:uncharacterized protein LOC103934724 [Pyrus x bretschneideri]|uniref:uncharacterized protein LOC103934724 n=1 Tax=Pyrus x bretschneideri TaxID=225117 RepID=UPI0005107FDB|nr:uncharacterized protein LOC103934724 [Pyrus x bretschneideri]
MAAILPNPFALKSNSNHRYLCYGAGRILQFTGQDPAPFFTTENAQTPGYMHIKYNAIGKYLVRVPGQTRPLLKIVATADTPNENTTDDNCTLFESENVGPNTPTQVVFRFRQVQSKLYIRPNYVQGLEGVLCALDANTDVNGVADLLTAVGPR